MDLADVASAVAAAIVDGKIQTKLDLQRVKHQAVRRLGIERMPQDPELLPYLDEDLIASSGHLFVKKPMRSQSGVAIVAVMSSPAGCPHGKCIYCPGGPEVDAPQSYTGFEPSTMRAKRLGYDPYRVVRTRLEQLQRNGHTIEKLELIVQGGTFPAREPEYQDWFIASLYAGCNDGPGDGSGLDEHAWAEMDGAERAERLAALQRDNETAACRVIGLTVETKPDWCFEEHVDAMLRHGATRIELGIQTLSEEVTKLTNRGHDIADARRAMRVARNAGYKVCVHMMPGLPRPTGEKSVYATDKAADIDDMEQLYADPDFRPDMLKIYPTLIVEEGETTLKRWWKDGRFEPLDTSSATDIVAEALRHVPEYCRIQRIDRDIPTTHVVAGVQNSNLRQLAEAEAEQRGIRLRDIRAREIGTRMRQGVAVDPARVELVRREYAANDGVEVFLSLEDPVADALVGFIRVRRVGATHRAELQDAAIVRELKVYGAAQGIGEHDPEAWQHQGHGRRLLEAAEQVAFEEWQVPRLAVIAGPGVKEYYRRHGYTDLGPYVAKGHP